MPKGRIKKAENRESLPRLGFLKIGEKDEKGVPHSLDYFKAVGKYAPLFHSVFGEKPQTVTIYFPSNDMSDVANEEYQLRDRAGRLVAYGDGETFFVHNPDTDKYEERAMDVMQMGEFAASHSSKWDITLTLKFLIDGVKVWGLWWLTTKGDDSSIPAITGVLDKLMKFPGRIAGIPFDLSVEKVKSNKPGSKSVFPVLSLIPNLTQEAQEKLNMLVRNYLELDGMRLTDDRINELSLQIEHKPEAPAIEAEVVVEEPKESTVEGITKIFGGPQESVIERAIKELEEAGSKQALVLIAKEISEREKWTEEEKAELKAAMVRIGNTFPKR
jgi:hypothetical protein